MELCTGGELFDRIVDEAVDRDDEGCAFSRFQEQVTANRASETSDCCPVLQKLGAELRLCRQSTESHAIGTKRV